MVTVKMVSDALEQLAPISLQESYDNAGLQVGNLDTEVRGILTTLDITEKVLDEAIQLNTNMIVSHHPLIFRPLKKLTDANTVEKLVRKAIMHDLILYTSHTNLDSVWQGVNDHLARLLGLSDVQILRPNEGLLHKLEVFVPEPDAGSLLDALGKAGAGQIGNYKNCSFRSAGIGSFTPTTGAKPAIGKLGVPEEVEEVKLEVLFPNYLTNSVLKAMKNAHPYEEIAYYLIPLHNEHQETGIGCVGTLQNHVAFHDFLRLVSDRLKIKAFKHTQATQEAIKKVAVCGGSGIFLIKDAKKAGADVFITSDIKYHDFFEAESKITLIDVGHFESETHTRFLLADFLSKKFPNIVVDFSKVDTNPVVTYIK